MLGRAFCVLTPCSPGKSDPSSQILFAGKFLTFHYYTCLLRSFQRMSPLQPYNHIPGRDTYRVLCLEISAANLFD